MSTVTIFQPDQFVLSGIKNKLSKERIDLVEI